MNQLWQEKKKPKTQKKRMCQTIEIKNQPFAVIQISIFEIDNFSFSSSSIYSN